MKAILNVSDHGPIESLAYMLRKVGYDCYQLSAHVRAELTAMRCDMGLQPDTLIKDYGYEPVLDIAKAGMGVMEQADLYVDVRANKNWALVCRRWPNLKPLWYSLYAGPPREQDDVCPPIPMLTLNQWYHFPGPWRNVYACWPYFVRHEEYNLPRAPRLDPPVCLVNHVGNWGHADLVGMCMREFGMKCHGANTPHGVLPHKQVKDVLAGALCMIHLKSADAAGYAICEAMAAGCPVVCSERFVWNTNAGAVLEHGKTCLTFRDEMSLRTALVQVRDLDENARLAANARKKLAEVQWSDVPGFKRFLESAYA